MAEKGATLGVISTASLAVNTIGQGLALARGRLPKHTIKQVDRLLSNAGINVDQLSERWVPYVIGQRRHIIVAMDWTDFDADDHATIMLSLITKHGRSTQLVWLTVDKATLKIHRNAYEYRVLVQLDEVVSAYVIVFIVVVFGLGYQILYLFFFFSSRRRHTRLTCDWSSDVCFPISPSRTARVSGPSTQFVSPPCRRNLPT